MWMPAKFQLTSALMFALSKVWSILRTTWKYYKVQKYDEESHICVMRTKEGIDVPYCINDRNTWASISNKVKSGEPPK